MPFLTTAPKANGEGVEQEIEPVLLDRETMGHWARTKIDKNELLNWQAHYNSSSLDGCPGMRSAMRDHGDWVWFTLAKARARRIWMQREALWTGWVLGVVCLLFAQYVQEYAGDRYHGTRIEG